MLSNNKFSKQRLDQNNIIDYLLSLEDNLTEVEMINQRILQVKPLLQNNYGKDGDCTLTAITTGLYYKLNGLAPINIIYDVVEKIADKYFYNGDTYGTIPFFIKKIYNEALSYFSLNEMVCEKYGKIFGYDERTVKKAIDNNKPVVLSMLNDGRGFYKNHTVTVIGYIDFKIFHKSDEIGLNKTIFAVYDNWTNKVSYVDYDKINIVSCINY